MAIREQEDGHILYFLLNHNEAPEQINLPQGTYTSLLTGKTVQQQVEIAARDVVVLLV